MKSNKAESKARSQRRDMVALVVISYVMAAAHGVIAVAANLPVYETSGSVRGVCEGRMIEAVW